MWTRAGAFAIDAVVAVAIFFTASFFLLVGTFAGPPSFANWVFIGVGFIISLFGLAVYVRFWANCQSPGKAAVGLQVVRRDGRPAGLVRMLVREMLLKTFVVVAPLFVVSPVWDLWPTLQVGSLLWYLWPLWDRENRAPHDILLRTAVVSQSV